MLVVTGKVTAANKSKSGKSISACIGGTWVSVNSEDLEAFKDAIGKGGGIPVRARTDLTLDDEGMPKMREFKKRDGTNGQSPDISIRYWFAAPKAAAGDLADLVGLDITAE
jgi:hypothetical protein